MGVVCCKADDPEGAGKSPNLVEVTTSAGPNVTNANEVQSAGLAPVTVSEVASAQPPEAPPQAAEGSEKVVPVEDNPDYWTVELSKTGGQRLACNIECKKGLVKITQIQPGGIMALWNEKNPTRAVADGSFVVEVNGAKVAPLQPTEVKRLFQKDQLLIVFSKQAPPVQEE